MCKICSDIEQYQKLVNAGIDPSTADMYWYMIDQAFIPEVNLNAGYKMGNDTPAWSLSKLISLLPDCIHIVSKYGTYTYNLDVCKDQIGYGKTGKFVLSPQGDLVDAAVYMLCWLHDNHEKYVS